MDVLPGALVSARVACCVRTSSNEDWWRTCCTSIRRKLEDMSELERGVCFKMVDMNCLLSSIRMPWFMSDCRVFSL